jgi:GGDEF domain-containing protein
MFPQDQRGSDDYMKFADAAMYQAKKSGGNRYYFQAN